MPKRETCSTGYAFHCFPSKACASDLMLVYFAPSLAFLCDQIFLAVYYLKKNGNYSIKNRRKTERLRFCQLS